jgi:hypothetical protein
MTRTFWMALAVAAAAGAAQSGCASPCDEDPLGCSAGEEFVPAGECDLEGPLEVSLGTGVDDFSPLATGQEPTVHHGPQGGDHLCLGLRVEHPTLDYPQLSVVMDAEVEDAARCDGDPSCDPWVGSAHRELVLGPELPLDAEDNVEETGLILILSIWPSDIERRVRVEVVDPCGRSAFVDHRIPPNS